MCRQVGGFWSDLILSVSFLNLQIVVIRPEGKRKYDQRFSQEKHVESHLGEWQSLIPSFLVCLCVSSQSWFQSQSVCLSVLYIIYVSVYVRTCTLTKISQQDCLALLVVHLKIQFEVSLVGSCCSGVKCREIRQLDVSLSQFCLASIVEGEASWELRMYFILFIFNKRIEIG